MSGGRGSKVQYPFLANVSVLVDVVESVHLEGRLLLVPAVVVGLVVPEGVSARVVLRVGRVHWVAVVVLGVVVGVGGPLGASVSTPGLGRRGQEGLH